MAGHNTQRGSMAVEFALVVGMFLVLVFGAIDIGRWLFALDAVTEAAREGARVAVVCDKGSAAVGSSMDPVLSMVSGGTTTVTYSPSGCCAKESTCLPACTGVTVRLEGYTVPPIAWFLPSMTIPTITNYLPRESMDSTGNSVRCS